MRNNDEILGSAGSRNTRAPAIGSDDNPGQRQRSGFRISAGFDRCDRWELEFSSPQAGRGEVHTDKEEI